MCHVFLITRFSYSPYLPLFYVSSNLSSIHLPDKSPSLQSTTFPHLPIFPIFQFTNLLDFYYPSSSSFFPSHHILMTIPDRTQPPRRNQGKTLILFRITRQWQIRRPHLPSCLHKRKGRLMDRPHLPRLQRRFQRSKAHIAQAFMACRTVLWRDTCRMTRLS